MVKLVKRVMGEFKNAETVDLALVHASWIVNNKYKSPLAKMTSVLLISFAVDTDCCHSKWDFM